MSQGKSQESKGEAGSCRCGWWKAVQLQRAPQVLWADEYGEGVDTQSRAGLTVREEQGIKHPVVLRKCQDIKGCSYFSLATAPGQQDWGKTGDGKAIQEILQGRR